MTARFHARRAGCRPFLLSFVILLSALVPMAASQPVAVSQALRSQVIGLVTASDEFKRFVGNERVRPLRVYIAEEKHEDGEARAPEAIVTFASYASGTGIRVRVDLSGKKVTEVARLPGRPQASEEERAEARKLILKDPAIRAVVDQGGYIEGGFVVDAPEGSKKLGRYLEFHVVAKARPMRIQEVIVDLSVGRIALMRSEDDSLRR